MDHSTISLILQEVNLNEKDVTNIYHHGSWVYGTNSPTSDRDLIIVTRSSNQKQIKFHEDFDYFHEFELYKLWNQYDICIYSVENFEILLEKNYLAVLQCLFLPNEFKFKEEIDFQKLYLEKYYNPLRLKQVAFYEMERDLNLYKSRNYSNHPVCSSRQIQTNQSRKNYIFKNFFHGIRFLDFAEQLIQTKSIYNYKRVTHLFDQMKDIRDANLSDDLGLERVFEFVQNKSAEYKSKFDALIPENIVKGSFEVHITFDCTHNTEHVIDKLEKACQNTRYKMVFIEWINYEDKENRRQLIVSSHYDGEYPPIVKKIEEEAYKHFKDFNILRIKIKSLISNEGVPQSDLENRLFWNDKTNYFEFRYKIQLKEDLKGKKLKILRDIRQLRFKSPSVIRLSRKVFTETHTKDLQLMITRCLFDVSRGSALEKHDEIVKYLTKKDFPLLKVIQEFIIYDKTSF